MRVIQTNSATGIMSMAAYMMIYCFMVSSAMMLIFGLPQTLPDRILRVIGGGVGDLGEQNTTGKMEGAASGQARNAYIMGGQMEGAKIKARNEQKMAAEKAQRSSSIEEMKQSSGGSGSYGVEGHSGQSSAQAPTSKPVERGVVDREDV